MRTNFLYNIADLVACLCYYSEEHNEYTKVVGTIVDREYNYLTHCNMYRIEWSDGKDEWYNGLQVEGFASCFREQVNNES